MGREGAGCGGASGNTGMGVGQQGKGSSATEAEDLAGGSPGASHPPQSAPHVPETASELHHHHGNVHMDL